MAVSVDDIVKKEFTRSLMGYDMQEVDVFLDAVIDRIEKMETEREELVTAMEKLLRRVERLEKARDVEKRALQSGEKSAKMAGLATNAAGPVRVQSGKSHAVNAVPEETPSRTKRTRSNPTGTNEPIRTETPLQSRPIRPVAQSQRVDKAGRSVFITAPISNASPTADAKPQQMDAVQVETPMEATRPRVVIEMETGENAPDAAAMIPDLMQDIEDALLESNIRSASHSDTPVRAADQTRVS